MPDKVVVITGGSAGIGAALTRLLAERDMTVVPVARRAELLEQVAADCNGRAHPVVADVGERTAVRGVVQQTLERFGHIDVWVNNVGRGITRMPSELTDADIDEIMQVNVKSALYGMQEVLPHFRERNAGHIINISSLLGRVPLATFRSAYSGAKHFLNALTAMFRAELQETSPGIHVSLVSPGIVRTEFGVTARHGGPDSRQFPDAQSADEVAAVIADVIASPRPDVYTRTGAQQRIAGYYAGLGVDP